MEVLLTSFKHTGWWFRPLEKYYIVNWPKVKIVKEVFIFFTFSHGGDFEKYYIVKFDLFPKDRSEKILKMKPPPSIVQLALTCVGLPICCNLGITHLPPTCKNTSCFYPKRYDITSLHPSLSHHVTNPNTASREKNDAKTRKDLPWAITNPQAAYFKAFWGSDSLT